MIKSDPLLLFTNSLIASGISVHGVTTGSNYQPGAVPVNLRIDFGPEATESQKSQAYSAAKSFDWSIKITDFNTFKKALFVDKTIPAAAKVELIKYFPILEQHLKEKEIVQAAWAQVKSTYQGSWLPAEIQSKVEEYAQTYGVPLV